MASLFELVHWCRTFLPGWSSCDSVFLLREPPDPRDRRLLSGGASDLIGMMSTASSVLQIRKVVEATDRDGLIRSLNPCPLTSLSLCAQGPRQEDLTVSYDGGSFVPKCRELGPGSLLLLCRMLNIYSDQRRTEEGEDQHSVHSTTERPPQSLPSSFSSYS